MLVDSTTTADTEKTVATISAFTTLGELSGTGYSRKALASETIINDTTNHLARFDATDVTWTAINAGTAAGLVMFKFITNDTDSVPLFWLDSGFPVVTNGSDLTIQWSTNGIFTLT